MMFGTSKASQDQQSAAPRVSQRRRNLPADHRIVLYRGNRIVGVLPSGGEKRKGGWVYNWHVFARFADETLDCGINHNPAETLELQSADNVTYNVEYFYATKIVDPVLYTIVSKRQDPLEVLRRQIRQQVNAKLGALNAGQFGDPKRLAAEILRENWEVWRRQLGVRVSGLTISSIQPPEALLRTAGEAATGKYAVERARNQGMADAERVNAIMNSIAALAGNGEFGGLNHAQVTEAVTKVLQHRYTMDTVRDVAKPIVEALQQVASSKRGFADHAASPVRLQTEGETSDKATLRAVIEETLADVVKSQEADRSMRTSAFHRDLVHRSRPMLSTAGGGDRRRYVNGFGPETVDAE